MRNLHMISKGISDGQRSISRTNIQSCLLCLINLKVITKRLRWRSKPKRNFRKKIFDGVLPLFSICTQICDNHGGVKEMQYSP
jgi:hypothetical protein